MNSFNTSVIIGSEPDFVMTEESRLHKVYPIAFQQKLNYAIIRAVNQGLLVTGYATRHDEATGNDEVFLIKWKRVA